MLTELQPFIGRFHPLLVHLPIGFLLLAGVVELLSRLKCFADAGISRLMPALLALCVLSTGGAIATYILAVSISTESLPSGHQDTGSLVRWWPRLGLPRPSVP